MNNRADEMEGQWEVGSHRQGRNGLFSLHILSILFSDYVNKSCLRLRYVDKSVPVETNVANFE